MRKRIFTLGLSTASALAAGTVSAQTSGGQGTGAGRPEVTVRAPERLVCRSVRRTSTRMRASRVCRPVSQLNADDRRTDDERLTEAADTLDVLGADDISTNCSGGLTSGHEGPLGPR